MEENKENLQTNEEENKVRDEFSIADGFKIDDTPYTPTSHSKKKGEKREKKSNPIIWIVSIVLVALILAFGIIFAGADYLGIGFGRENLGECEVTITSGATTTEIASELKETGAVKSAILFRLFAKAKHYDGKFRDGYHHFNPELGYDGIAQILMQNGKEAKNVKVTIVEGATVDEIAELLDKKGVCTKEDFIYEVQEGEFDFDFVKQIPTNSVYYRLEGYLYPETYKFSCYDSKECAHLAVEKMLSTLNKKLLDKNVDINNISVMGKSYSFHEIMSMSSIIELEAGKYPKEMSKVAAIFFKRMDNPDFPTLGSSPTRKYPYGDGSYDTYQCKGLPVGPLCSPDINAIMASIEPKENFDYYFFVTDAKMKFYYTKTLNEHNRIIAKLKSEKNWIYEE